MPETRVHRRSSWFRGWAAAGALLSTLALGALGAAGELGWNLPTVVVGVMVLGSAYAVLAATGDLFCTDSSGVHYRNRFSARGLFAPWRLPWSEVASVQRWRPGVLVLRDRAGRRYVIDGVEEPEALRSAVAASTEARTPP